MTSTTVAKVVELLAEGNTIEAAAESALSEAAKTVQNIRSLYIKDIQALIENGKIAGYRINAKVSFVVKH